VPRVTVLNQNHARRIASTFAYVDNLLQTVERLASTPGIRQSEFTREQPDLSETEARLLLSLVVTARERMLTTLEHLGLPRPQANLSARWSVMTAFRFVDIALSELTAKELGGYGRIDAGSAAEVTAVASELRELIARGREMLSPHAGEKLRDRLAVLGGPAGEVLRLAEETSRQLGLVEVRALIAAAADRVEASTIDIGIFGRVSSGKSSLINALVGTPLLPVGATPVTAVPLRVLHGADAIEVAFVDGHRESIDSSHLADYATERGNRDNVKRVESILIQVPRVPQGVVLLDTPGIGSLSHSGPAQAFAWLPRCDLGIVLIAAGTPIGRDELALVSGLTNAGIQIEILLSKSDLISESERDAAIDYVRAEVSRATGVSKVAVRAVSVMPSDVALLQRWRDGELLPLVAARQRVASEARTRRVRAILAALNGGLANRHTIDSWKLGLHRARADAESEISAAAEELEASARPTLDRAASDVVSAWRGGADARTAAQHALLEAPNRALTRARSAADRTLGSVQQTTDAESGARIPPLFDPRFLDALPIAPRPGRLDRLLGAMRARQQLRSLAGPLDDAYGTYANRVRAWGLERMEENLERVRSSRSVPLDSDVAVPDAGIAPELRSLAALIDRYFPSGTG
jgi:GTP-binding protein EngB required for normal cell division